MLQRDGESADVVDLRLGLGVNEAHGRRVTELLPHPALNRGACEHPQPHQNQLDDAVGVGEPRRRQIDLNAEGRRKARMVIVIEPRTERDG